MAEVNDARTCVAVPEGHIESLQEKVFGKVLKEVCPKGKFKKHNQCLDFYIMPKDVEEGNLSNFWKISSLDGSRKLISKVDLFLEALNKNEKYKDVRKYFIAHERYALRDDLRGQMVCAGQAFFLDVASTFPLKEVEDGDASFKSALLTFIKMVAEGTYRKAEPKTVARALGIDGI